MRVPQFFEVCKFYAMFLFCCILHSYTQCEHKFLHFSVHFYKDFERFQYVSIEY